MSYQSQIPYLNANTSKKKNLILISTFEGERSFSGEVWKEFHFKGFLLGNRVSEVLLKTGLPLSREEYIVRGYFVNLIGESLIIKAESLCLLSELKEDFF